MAEIRPSFSTLIFGHLNHMLRNVLEYVHSCLNLHNTMNPAVRLALYENLQAFEDSDQMSSLIRFCNACLCILSYNLEQLRQINCLSLYFGLNFHYWIP